MKKTAALQRAREWATKGDLSKAIQECQALSAQFPDDPEVSLCLGEVFLKNQEVHRAIEAYDQAANFFLRDGAAIHAITSYKQILKLESDRPEICVTLGDLQAARGFRNNAIADYLAGAKLYARRERSDSSIEAYRKVLALNPHNACARLRIAELFIGQGCTDEAIREYLYVAGDYEELQRFEEARALYELVQSLAPDQPEIRRRLEAMEQKDTEESEPGSFVATQADTTFVDARESDLSELSLDLGQLGTVAASSVEIPLPPEEKPADSLVLAQGPAEADQSNGAEDNFPEALSRELEQELETQFELALAYKDMGLLDDAIDTFERTMRAPSRFFDSCALIAMCYKSRHVNTAAINWLEKVSRHPQCDGPLALFIKHTLAELYEQEGQTEKAGHLYATIPLMQDAAQRLLGKRASSTASDKNGPTNPRLK
jgi:tetratricopeptide (TPR) repeat protein